MACAQGGVGDGLFECGPQMVDRGRGLGEQGGAAQFVQDGGPVLDGGRLAQCAGEAAAGGVRGTGAQGLARGLAQLLDHPGVALGVRLQQVPGGGGGAEPGVDDRPGGLAVHGDAQARGWPGRRRWRSAGGRIPSGSSRAGEDAGVAQPVARRRRPPRCRARRRRRRARDGSRCRGRRRPRRSGRWRCRAAPAGRPGRCP